MDKRLKRHPFLRADSSSDEAARKKDIAESAVL